MATLFIMVVVAACCGCFYFGWKQGIRLGERRALERITYRAEEAERRTQEEVRRREAAEHKCENEKIRADAWEKSAKKESLAKEKKAAEKRQKDWEEWLHKQQCAQQGMGYGYLQQMLGAQTATYSNDWFRGLFGHW